METVKLKNLIIGFGKAGKTLAKFLASHDEEVVVVEQSPQMYGGTCINVGCIPSKSLIVNGQKGMTFTDAIRQKHQLTKKLNGKNYHMIADENLARVVDGKAHFVSNHQVEVVSPDGLRQTIESERIFINTGSKALIPEIEGLKESKQLMTSTELMDLDALPEHLLIIGSGYIGLEFASMMKKYGSSVTVLDHSDQFLAREDEDFSARIKKDLEKDGIVFRLGVNVNQINDEGNQTRIHFINEKGRDETIIADKILVATGRKANTDELGLENTTVQLGQRGEIVVNEKLETGVKGVWAVGDVHGGQQFTYASLDDFRIIQDQLFGEQKRILNNRGPLPYSVFITPALSSVGLNEKRAEHLGIQYRLFTLDATSIPKSAILSQPKGFLKALVAKESDEILGATIYGEESYEVINIISLAMKAHLPYTLLRDQIYTHPTMTEALNDLFATVNEKII